MSEIRITEAPAPKGEKEDTPEKLSALDRLMELQALAEDGLLCTYEKESKFTFEQVCRLMAEFGREIESEWREWGLSEWRRALHDLTPGGSEFADDPKRCAEWVKDSRQSQHRAIVRFKTAKDAAESKLAAYDRVCDALVAAEKELAETGLKLRDTAQQVLHLDAARVMLIEHREELQQKLTALSAILDRLKELQARTLDISGGFAGCECANEEFDEGLRAALPELLRVMEGK